LQSSFKTPVEINLLPFSVVPAGQWSGTTPVVLFDLMNSGLQKEMQAVILSDKYWF